MENKDVIVYSCTLAGLLHAQQLGANIGNTNIKNETLELLNINKNAENNYNRTPYEKSATLMLQGVLCFTGDYLRQFWLTPYLYYLLHITHRTKMPTIPYC